MSCGARVSGLRRRGGLREPNISEERLAVGRALVERVQEAIAERELASQPVYRKSLRRLPGAGGYNVMLVDLYWNKVPRLALKISAPLADLGLPASISEPGRVLGRR